jgi:hypothetical protein
MVVLQQQKMAVAAESLMLILPYRPLPRVSSRHLVYLAIRSFKIAEAVVRGHAEGHWVVVPRCVHNTFRSAKKLLFVRSNATSLN